MMCVSQWVLNRPRHTMKEKVCEGKTSVLYGVGHTNEPDYSASYLGGVEINILGPKILQTLSN